MPWSSNEKSSFSYECQESKGWNEMSPAESAQNYNRLFLLCSGQGEQQEDKGRLLREGGVKLASEIT